MTFGLIIGSAILVLLLWMLIKIIVKDLHSIHTQFTILLFCSSIVMLMFSSSFLQEPMLYLFIGYMVNIFNKLGYADDVATADELLKEDIIKKLDEAGIKYNAKDNKETLFNLLQGEE